MVAVVASDAMEVLSGVGDEAVAVAVVASEAEESMKVEAGARGGAVGTWAMQSASRPQIVKKTKAT